MSSSEDVVQARPYSNYSHSIQFPGTHVVDVEMVSSIPTLLRQNELGKQLVVRPRSGGHDYSYVTTGTGPILLLNLDHLQDIEWDAITQRIGVEPGVTFAMASTYLEGKGKKGTYPRKFVPSSLRNFPMCNNLTLVGSFCMNSHGSGYQASWVDQVEAIEVIRAGSPPGTPPATVFRQGATADEFAAWAGGMGVLGVITRLWARTYPIEKIRDTHLFFHSFAEVETYFANEGKDAGGAVLPLAFTKEQNFDQIFWTPLSDHFIVLTRRFPSTIERKHLDDVHARESQTWWGEHIVDPLVPTGAKLVNNFRSWKIIAPHTAANWTASSYEGEIETLGIYNTLFRLNEPVSNVVQRLNRAYDVGEDCELFFPVETTADCFRILRAYNDVLRIVMKDNDIKDDKWLSSIAKPLIEEHQLEKRMLDCTADRRAAYTAPMEVRFLPATTISAMAPNYKQNCMAISFAWFGTDSPHHEANRRFHRFLLAFGWKAFKAVFHSGKFNMLESHAPEDLEIIEGWKEHYAEGRERLRKYISKTSEQFVTPMLKSFIFEAKGNL